jgi:hypothetical protein
MAAAAHVGIDLASSTGRTGLAAVDDHAGPSPLDDHGGREQT